MTSVGRKGLHVCVLQVQRREMIVTLRSPSQL